jgi:hypothetical protein
MRRTGPVGTAWHGRNPEWPHPRDTTLLALAETLMTIDAALTAGDVNPLSDRARRSRHQVDVDRRSDGADPRHQPRGRRAKAIAVQWAAEKLSPPPCLFVDLALSLARDLAAPLTRAGA